VERENEERVFALKSRCRVATYCSAEARCMPAGFEWSFWRVEGGGAPSNLCGPLWASSNFREKEERKEGIGMKEEKRGLSKRVEKVKNEGESLSFPSGALACRRAPAAGA